MKMVKSLLLGSAAGIVAIAGAQAADLPVKAKAVEYVKICSLYGKGFYYVPGSDMCLSITGFVRFQVYSGVGGQGAAPASAGAGGSATNGYQQFNDTTTPFGAPNGYGTRALGYNDDLTYRTRVMVTFDSRQQTAYGTLRAVATTGFTNDAQSGGSAGTFIYANRGFIQIAGFTFGKAVSFYDFYCAPCYSYIGTAGPSDTGDGGKMVAAFTAQFGGGVSATISAEEPRRGAVINTAATTGNLVTSAAGGNDPVNIRYPDLVGTVRWDQNWGAFQVMGGIHDASGAYYGANALGQQNNGHPGDAWGWVLGAGVKFLIGADVFDIQGQYTQGATSYFNGAAVGLGGYKIANGQSLAYGVNSDAVYGTNAAGALTGIDLTTMWGVVAAYDHRWSPALKTSIYGGYLKQTYNAEATQMLCTMSNANTGLSAATATTGVCSQDFAQWYVGSRTQWDVARNFYVGVDVLYTKLQTANSGGTTVAGFTPVAAGPRPSGTYSFADQDAWVFTFRAHRDIVP